MAHAVLSGSHQRPSVNLSIRPTSPEAVSTSMVRPFAFVVRKEKDRAWTFTSGH
jgi:hypothetical protein